MNPASIVKFMGAKAQFERNHPKFTAFIKSVVSRSPEVGTVIEVTVTRPDGKPVTANFKVRQTDLELLEELKEIL